MNLRYLLYESFHEHWTLFILVLPAGQDKTSPKLRCGKVVLFPIIVLPNLWLLWKINYQVYRCRIPAFLSLYLLSCVLLNSSCARSFLFCNLLNWMIFSDNSSTSWVWLLSCVVDVGRTIQGSQDPLWGLHKRKLLIRVMHPVYEQTVNLFNDGNNQNTLTLRSGCIYHTNPFLACFVPLGTVSLADSWCERRTGATCFIEVHSFGSGGGCGF